MIPIEWLHAARERIKDTVKITPLTYDEFLGVFFKWENQQVTGSFKVRGAANKVFSLPEWELENGVITCSAGNHGQGCALACQKRGVSCEVIVSEHAVPSKIAAMQALGADVRLVKGDYSEAEHFAIRQAELSGKTFISPYNDVQVIAGQGTLGLELAEQTNQFEKIKTLVVPAGGGGLLSGIGVSLEFAANRPQLFGAQSEASPYLHSLFHYGTQEGIFEKESIADGLAGEVDHRSITIPLVDKYADEILLVTEKQIAAAIRYAWEKHHQVIEGSAAVTLAAILAGKKIDLPAILVITGGNIQPELHRTIVEKSE
jgi:threonine dehydratase